MDSIRQIRNALLTPDIKFILLDMDGTLLDKYFDDYFWEHLVPHRYAEKYNITFGQAREELFKKYKSHEGTLNWTDVDFWSRELKLDIMALKEQVRHLIEVHPHVEDFLRHMRKRKKMIYIVTNAHYRVLDMKLKKTELGKYFNGAYTSFDIGFPKEDTRFWERLQRKIHFEKERTLFIDDTLEILHVAERFGIKYLLHKSLASSKKGEVKVDGFPSIRDFSHIDPDFRE